MLRQKCIGIFCALPSEQSVCIGNISVSFLGVSAIRQCEYVENFPDAIINCRVVAALLLLLTNALGHASECFCFKLEACLLNCKSLYSVYHQEEVLGVDVVPMSLMCSFKCNF